MYKSVLFIFFISLFCNLKLIAQVSVNDIPKWINEMDYSLTPDIDKDDITQGTTTLLYDFQVHIPAQKAYSKYVTKITDNVGIQEASNVSVDYDPTYQTLEFHELHILRGGEIINKLEPKNFQVLRRETNAENYLYDGSMTAMINLTDVRTDDIIVSSYSIIGFNPIHKGNFSYAFYFNNYEPVGQISVSIFSNEEINYKQINTSLEPIKSKKDQLNSYCWINKNTSKIEYEEYTPSWKQVGEMISVSNYDSWEQVVNWGIDTYAHNEKIDIDLKNEIKAIANEYPNEGKRIKKTLDFVQNEIRYLGLEDGIGAYKPFTPNTVYKQRFGDCKDKSLILTTMLNEMGIEAYPMLVNSYLKHSINSFLPSPIFFDHSVVKVVTSEGKNLYYDPTYTNQGGTYDKVFFPNYAYGLVLQKGVKNLERIPHNSTNKIIVSDEYFLEPVGKGATLKITTDFYEKEADGMRNYFKNSSINSIAKEFENFYANYYFDISSTKNPEVADDLNANKFTVIEEYKIDSLWAPMEDKKNYIEAYFTPTSLLNNLYVPNKAQRLNEVELYYPSYKEHNIKVHLPEDWGVEDEKNSINSSAFEYSDDVNYSRFNKVLTIDYKLKIKEDYLKTAGLKEYIKDATQVNNSLGYLIYIPNPQKTGSLNTEDILNSLKPIFYLLIIVIVFLAGMAIYNQKKNS